MSKIAVSILCSTLLASLAAGQPQAVTSVETSLDTVNASDDNQAAGSVRIDQESGELKVSADVRKLKPGKYSLKIHEKGDCGDDSNKAGSPLKGGDLGIVTVSENGTGQLGSTLRGLSLNEGSNAVNGRAVILSSQSGKPLACGVLTPPRF